MLIIDRTKFLLLASSIAASSCTVVHEEPDVSDNDFETDFDDTDEDASAGGTEATDVDGTGADAGPDATEGTDDDPVADGGSGESDDAGSSEQPGLDASAPSGDAAVPATDSGVMTGDGGMPETDAGAWADGGPSMCLGGEGTVPSCEGLGMSSLDSFQSGQCDRAATMMKPGVAQQFRECMLAQSEQELEDATNTYTCKLEAALAACEDEDSLATCEAMQGYCPDQDIDECRDHVNGLTPEGHAEMIACAESFCFGVYSCLEGL